jgi:3-hydroxyisobutyrate dehydrogenase-like beta-hydroxyacid dehydrogenase
MDIGFIGLGRMGRGMVSRLLEAGHHVTAWNRTRAAGDALAARGMTLTERIEDTLASGITISMLADDAAVDAVWISGGLVQRLSRDALHLNMASISPALGARMAVLHGEAGAHYAAAPVFGRPEFAARGELDIVAAGTPEALSRCEPLFTLLGRRWFRVADEAPKANALKVARNFLLATIIEGMGEAMALAQQSGVDPRVFYDIVTSTAMNSNSHKNYGKLMMENPDHPSFSLRLGLKDVELALDTAHRLGLALPSAELMQRQHQAAIADGYGEHDWAALGTWIMDGAAGRIQRQSLPNGNAVQQGCTR